MKKDLLSLNDYSEKEILDILELAHKLKKETKEGKEHHILKGKTLGMIFSKSFAHTAPIGIPLPSAFARVKISGSIP